MFRKRSLNFLIIFIAILAILGCAGSFNKRSFNALGTMGVTYDTALKSAADLYKRGLISDEGKSKIIEAANSYRVAHEDAVTAFQQYLSLPPEQQAESKQKFITLSQVALSAYSELLSVLTTYGVYGEPVKPWF